MRRQALGGASDGEQVAAEGDGESARPADDVDVPRSAVDPRALRFREALSQIPDLEHGDALPDDPGEPTPPPTSTSQQIIDLDAIPIEPRLPNTAEVDLAERLRSVPDGTPLPAVRTRLARSSRARSTVSDDVRESDPSARSDVSPTDGEPAPVEADPTDPAERPVVDLGPAGVAPVADVATEADVEVDGPAVDGPVVDGPVVDGPVVEVGEALGHVGEGGLDEDSDLFDVDDRDARNALPGGSSARATPLPARSRARAKHSKARARRTATSVPPRPPWWRRAAFAVTLVALIAAVPVLFVAGYRTITRSTDGQLNLSSLTREDPGYEELVTSTPTAVLTQLDAEGTPIAQTLLSLSNNGGGGSVVFIPLETELAAPAFGVTTLRTIVTMSPRPPAEVRGGVVPQIAKLLNVGIDETFELDDAGWSQMLASVGPIDIQNPDPVEVLGASIDAGPVSLAPDQIGGYLGALRWGETQLNQFVRHEEIWRSWLERVAASPDGDVVPGEGDAGLGMFIRTLAAGPVTYLTLPGDFGDDGIYRTDEAEVRDLVVEHIPAPDPASPGSRVTVRLLNGVEPSEPSTEIVRQIVANKGSVSVVGNAASFDRDLTDIVFSDPEMEPAAVYMGAVLNIGGQIRLDPTSSDAVDLTIIVGRDLHDPPGGS